MAALLRPLIDLCLLRGGPQELPHSIPATVVMVVALVGAQLGFAWSQGLPEATLSARVVVSLVLLLGVTPVLLERRDLGNRLAQVILAQAGTSLIFTLATQPIARAMQPWVGNPEPPPHMLPISLVALFLVFWKLRVEAAIWRQSLDIRHGAALALALALMVAELVLMLAFMPAPVPASG